MACEEELAALNAANNAIDQLLDTLADNIVAAQDAQDGWLNCLEGEEEGGEESAARSSKTDWAAIKADMRTLKSMLPGKK